MKKRCFLEYASAALAGSLLPAMAGAQILGTTPPLALSDKSSAGSSALPSVFTLAAAWRGNAGVPGDFVGLLRVDWDAGLVQVKSAVSVPSRAHGLLAESDGGFLAVASRPGKWLVRCDAGGQAVQWHQMESESEGRTLEGHFCASADGQWIYTVETNPLSGQGWVAVRDRRTLRKVAQWRSHGAEPHQLLLDRSGALVVANGGIFRADGDKKRDLHLMDSSLVRLNPVSGERLGQWRLKDSRLGLRHLAWSQPVSASNAEGQDKPLLGIALQNEHDDLTLRRSAPVLAVWDGEKLSTPTLAPSGGGYAGDIVAGPDGGFLLSCQRAGIALQWSPKAPADLVAIANLQEVGALANWGSAKQPHGVLLGAAKGLGRWHPATTPGFLSWPSAMAVDNHWVVV